MRICILPVTILVLLFQPEEYKCDPVDVNIGPPLRPYSVIPVSHKLKSKITGNVTSAGNVTLQVTLAGETETITSCQWTSPGDVNFTNILQTAFLCKCSGLVFLCLHFVFIIFFGKRKLVPKLLV